MCGRVSFALDLDDLLAVFPEFRPPEQLQPRDHIAPTQPVPVVADDGQAQIAFYHWGLVPSWAKDPSLGNRMINARAETLAEKPAFRAAYRKRRCLILADGFYEWREEPGRQRKTPMYIRMASGEPFAFAGLWEVWSGQEPPLYSCTIITTMPNDLLAPIHDRMPVILPRSAYKLWLDPEDRLPSALQALLAPYPAAEMTAFPVSQQVNSPENDRPECILPA